MHDALRTKHTATQSSRQVSSGHRWLSQEPLDAKPAFKCARELLGVLAACRQPAGVHAKLSSVIAAGSQIVQISGCPPVHWHRSAGCARGLCRKRLPSLLPNKCDFASTGSSMVCAASDLLRLGHCKVELGQAGEGYLLHHTPLWPDVH